MAREHSNIKGIRRESKRQKRQHGQRTSGRSVFTIQEIQIKKSQKVKEGK